MENFDTNQVADVLRLICRETAKVGLNDFLLIGGNAVIAYGVPRFTRDVDFVIPERESRAWRRFLEDRGFPFIHGTSAFSQFQDKEERRPRVDLMIVDESTWSSLHEKAVSVEFERGVKVKLAAPQHLIAMKLRAVQSEHRRVGAVDWEDIVELSAREKLDPESDDDFADLVLKFGSEDLLLQLVKDLRNRSDGENESENHEE